LPIASAGRTQWRIGFIFQIVDPWRALPLALREGQQARGHVGSRSAPALIPAAPATWFVGVPARAPVARLVVERQAAFRAGALPDPRRVAIGDLGHPETCDPGRRGRGFRGLRHAQRGGEATANHKPLRDFVGTGQCRWRAFRAPRPPARRSAPFRKSRTGRRIDSVHSGWAPAVRGTYLCGKRRARSPSTNGSYDTVMPAAGRPTRRQRIGDLQSPVPTAPLLTPDRPALFGPAQPREEAEAAAPSQPRHTDREFGRWWLGPTTR
jgi:hypothetical protein